MGSGRLRGRMVRGGTGPEPESAGSVLISVCTLPFSGVDHFSFLINVQGDLSTHNILNELVQVQVL